MKSTLHFTATIEIKGVNPYVLVTKKLAEKLKRSWKKPMPVLVQVNGEPLKPWHINMMPVGNGDFYLYLHGEVRKASKTFVGDRVTVDVSFDPSYHGGPSGKMPKELQHLLESQPLVCTHWEKLSPSRQKEIVRYLQSLKSKDALERNIFKISEILSGKTGRFMARDWKDGK